MFEKYQSYTIPYIALSGGNATEGYYLLEVLRIEPILSEEKPNQREKISFSAARIRPLIPEHYSRSQTEEYIVKALQYYQRHLDQQRQNRYAR